MKILVIIPCFNEEANIVKVVNGVKKFNYDYLIINDASTDNSEKILKENNYNFLSLVNNVGLASVTRIGFKDAYDNGYDGCICVDGDGQHPADEIIKLLECLKDNDYVLGSRFINKKKPLTLRMLGSEIISLAIKIKTNKIVKDPTSGMRAIGRRIMKEFSNSMNFIAEPDALCYIIKKGYKYKEVEVNMVDRIDGVSYFQNPIKAIKYMVSVLISIILIQ